MRIRLTTATRAGDTNSYAAANATLQTDARVAASVDAMRRGVARAAAYEAADVLLSYEAAWHAGYVHPLWVDMTAVNASLEAAAAMAPQLNAIRMSVERRRKLLIMREEHMDGKLLRELRAQGVALLESPPISQLALSTSPTAMLPSQVRVGNSHNHIKETRVRKFAHERRTVPTGPVNAKATTQKKKKKNKNKRTQPRSHTSGTGSCESIIGNWEVQSVGRPFSVSCESSIRTYDQPQ